MVNQRFWQRFFLIQLPNPVVPFGDAEDCIQDHLQAEFMLYHWATGPGEWTEKNKCTDIWGQTKAPKGRSGAVG